MPPSTELLKTLRRVLLDEQARRAKQRGLEPGLDGRTQLYVKLDQMRENRERLGNPYSEVSPKERADLIAYLTARAAETAKQ
jgi:hypothetical protein